MRTQALRVMLAAALGSGFAPVALADSFEGVEDTTLTVAAPGVLGNDLDVDGDALMAALVDDVSAEAGALLLAADGSFEFAPAQDFNGEVTFTYMAMDPSEEGSEVVACAGAISAWAPCRSR